MNIILLRPEQLNKRNQGTPTIDDMSVGSNSVDSNEALLDTRQSKHCVEVLNLKQGDALQVGILNHKLGEAVYDSIDSNTSRARIKLDFNALNHEPPSPSQIHLYLALPRPKMLRRIFRTAAECGVKHLTLFNSSKVEKSYWQTPSLEAARAEQYFIEGLEQSKDTRLPELHIEKLFRPFIEDKVSKLTDIVNPRLEDHNAWVAHPYNTEHDLRDIKLALNNAKVDNIPLHLFVGPEGGFSKFEIDLLQKSGVRSFRANERILRTETFISWILGAIEGQ